MKKITLWTSSRSCGSRWHRPSLPGPQKDDLRTIKKAVRENPDARPGREVRFLKVLVLDERTGREKAKITLPIGLVDFVAPLRGEHPDQHRPGRVRRRPGRPVRRAQEGGPGLDHRNRGPRRNRQGLDGIRLRERRRPRAVVALFRFGEDVGQGRIDIGKPEDESLGPQPGRDDLLAPQERQGEFAQGDPEGESGHPEDRGAVEGPAEGPGQLPVADGIRGVHVHRAAERRAIEGENQGFDQIVDMNPGKPLPAARPAARPGPS